MEGSAVRAALSPHFRRSSAPLRAVTLGVVIVVVVAADVWQTSGYRHAAAAMPGPSAPVAANGQPVVAELDAAPTGGGVIAGPLDAALSSVLATFATRSGESAQVVAGSTADKTRQCVELRTAEMAAMSCWPAQSPGAAIHVQRSTFRGEAFVTGIASPAVRRIAGTRPDGTEVAVQLRDGAFFAEERSALELQATGANGKPLGTAHVNGPDPSER